MRTEAAVREPTTFRTAAKRRLSDERRKYYATSGLKPLFASQKCDKRLKAAVR
jgi:hypothetical protein